MAAPVVGDADLQSVRRIRLDVSGMSCAACASRVETKLNKIPGVRASVNFATRVATIDAVGMAADELCGVVEKAGYHAAPHTETTVL
ncbi:cation transporter, partial [Mycobacterium tuberculosis]